MGRSRGWKVTLRVLDMSLETRLCDRIIYSRTVDGFRSWWRARWYAARHKPIAHPPHHGDYIIERTFS